MRTAFVIIGISDASVPHFSAEVLDCIRSGKVFSGGRRHHEIVEKWLPKDAQWIDITVPLDSVFDQYARYFSSQQGAEGGKSHGSIVVFASGDPLFFGFANTVRRKMPDALITVYPCFNSLQMLAHRLVMPYHDMHIVSLTGRPWHEFDAALIRRHSKIGILTDGRHTPSAIARRMMEYGYVDYAMSVGVRMGNPEQELVTTLPIREAAERDFDMPNCVVIEAVGETQAAGIRNPETGGARIHPIPDHLFELLDGREKMITKAPIRQLTLAALELYKRTSFWDVGFCTGSVSIEAKLQYPHLYVTAFEIREEGRRLMDVNSHRFGAPGIEPLIGDFLQLDVSTCPQPDCIFIGGHGGHLDEVVRKCAGCLKKGGVVVYNCVSPQSVTDSRIRTDSYKRFVETCAACGMQVEQPLHVAINDYHPIDILKARKI